MNWNERLKWVRDLVRGHADEADLVGGWEFLASALEEKAWTGFLGHFLSNLAPSSLVRHGRLGQLLRSLTNGPGYSKVIERLQDKDENTVRGMLAELAVLWTLRRRGLTVDFRGHLKGADLAIHVQPPLEIEVSYLGVSTNWQMAQLLEQRLASRLYEDLHRQRKVFFIDVECRGYPRPLLGQVDAACDRFLQRIDDPRPWTVQLTDGLNFTVMDYQGRSYIHVHGATIYGAGTSTPECALRRIPAKLEEESPQVAAGGVVLIWTSEMTPLTLQVQDIARAEFEEHVYAQAIADISNIGEREKQVGAFAVLDEMGTEATRAPAIPGPASLVQAETPLGRQRLLWIPNPHAVVPVNASALDWLKPPLGFESET